MFLPCCDILLWIRQSTIHDHSLTPFVKHFSEYLMRIYNYIGLIFIGTYSPGCRDDKTGRGHIPISNSEGRRTGLGSQQTKINNLLMCIQGEGLHPPIWIRNHDFTNYAKKVVVYYDVNAAEARLLAEQRTPPTKGDRKMYDESKFKGWFGYSDPAYSVRSSNIAIFTPTPALLPGTEHHVDINILNAIPPDLSSEHTPDYHRLFILPDLVQRQEAYMEMMRKVMIKIKYCMSSFSFRELVMPALGVNRASVKIGNALSIDVQQAFADVYKQYFNDNPRVVGFNVPFMKGIKHTESDDLYQLIAMYDGDNDSGLNLQDVLFVNDASPTALLGSGFGGGPSLDSKFGKISAISVLGWSQTNDKIRYVKRHVRYLPS